MEYGGAMAVTSEGTGTVTSHESVPVSKDAYRNHPSISGVQAEEDPCFSPHSEQEDCDC